MRLPLLGPGLVIEIQNGVVFAKRSFHYGTLNKHLIRALVSRSSVSLPSALYLSLFRSQHCCEICNHEPCYTHRTFCVRNTFVTCRNETLLTKLLSPHRRGYTDDPDHEVTRRLTMIISIANIIIAMISYDEQHV